MWLEQMCHHMFSALLHVRAEKWKLTGLNCLFTRETSTIVFDEGESSGNTSYCYNYVLLLLDQIFCLKYNIAAFVNYYGSCQPPTPIQTSPSFPTARGSSLSTTTERTGSAARVPLRSHQCSVHSPSPGQHGSCTKGPLVLDATQHCASSER